MKPLLLQKIKFNLVIYLDTVSLPIIAETTQEADLNQVDINKDKDQKITKKATRQSRNVKVIFVLKKIGYTADFHS